MEAGLAWAVDVVEKPTKQLKEKYWDGRRDRAKDKSGGKGGGRGKDPSLFP